MLEKSWVNRWGETCKGKGGESRGVGCAFHEGVIRSRHGGQVKSEELEKKLDLHLGVPGDIGGFQEVEESDCMGFGLNEKWRTDKVWLFLLKYFAAMGKWERGWQLERDSELGDIFSPIWRSLSIEGKDAWRGDQEGD